MTETFLKDKVTLHCGDCLEVMAALAENSVDAAVTDPPYGLQFMNRGWDKLWRNGTEADIAYVKRTDGELTSRARKLPDYSATKPARMQAWHEAWAREVYRVLKPGAHLLAFGGTRTYHRMACAIEDAGFEIRDTIMWVYGSGFPKSHDVSKGIDRRGPPGQVPFAEFAAHYETRRKALGYTHAKVCAIGGWHGDVNHGGSSVNWANGYGMPTIEQWEILQPLMGLDKRWEERVQREEYEREVIGKQRQGKLAVAPGQGNDRSQVDLDVTAPGSDVARQWQGWGTALKPACEPIVLARKPLAEKTVAANVLRWGVGALNIDGCRIPSGQDHADKCASVVGLDSNLNGNDYGEWKGKRTDSYSPAGRWPSNLIHDDSEEVLAGFPESDHARGNSAPEIKGSSANQTVYGHFNHIEKPANPGDSGSAARFFYTAKADSDDRLGSKHPTVKPLDLMQYLIRLVCPKNGTVIDPFAGTGTAGEAAWREGTRAVLIEREAEYQADIRRRMALCLSGPDERGREAAKARMAGKPRDDGPLFGGKSDWDEMWQRPFDYPERL